MINKVTFLGEIADKQFKNWQAENAEAFYLNIKSKKTGVLHKANCWHLGEGEGMNSASNAKICSNVSGELKEWAESNDLEFEICSDCLK